MSLAAARRKYGVDEVELRRGVDHERHARGELGRRRQPADGYPVDARVADHDVVDGLGQPERFGEGVGEHAVESRTRHQLLDDAPDAHGLARDADGRSTRARHHVVGIVAQGVELQGGERRLELCRRSVDRPPVGPGVEPGLAGGRTVEGEDAHRTLLTRVTARAPSAAHTAASRKSPVKPPIAATRRAPRSGAMA